MVNSISTLLGTTQALLLVLFLTCTTTPADNVLTTAEYNIFRDIMVMLLLGFGFLMTFLRKYGLSAVGLTMLLTVIAIQLNFFVEPFIRFVYNGKSQVDFPLPMGITNLIDGEFSAATVLISFGAVIGRATPVQLLLMTVFQAFFYAINKVMIVYGAWGAEDVGGKSSQHKAKAA
jgi:ammonium transporter Rh